MAGAAWLSLIWALAMFSKGSSVYCADGIGASSGSWSRYRQFFKRGHHSFTTGQLHYPPSLAVSELQRTDPLVRQHSDSELCSFARTLPALQEADFGSISIG